MKASCFVIIALVVIVYVNAQVTIPAWVTAQKTPWSRSNANKRLGCSSVLPGAYKQIECICSFLEDQINVRGTPEYSLAQTYRIGWDYVFPKGSPNVNPLEAYSLSLRADVYDNSVAAILLMLAGQMESARRICDTLVLLVDLDKVGDGRTRTAYYQNNPVQREYDGSVPITYGAQIFDYDVLTGNLAFEIIALARFYHHTNDYKYLQAAIKIAKFIDNNLRYDSAWGGFAAGMQYNATSDTESNMFWRSTEHNVDVFAAARLLYSLTEDNQWKDMMNHAKSFINKMYQTDGGFYYVGTSNEQNKDEWITLYPACDAQTWNLLSEADDDVQRKTNSLNWVLKNLQVSEYQEDPLSGQSLQYNGVLFSSGGTGIQSEQTAAAAMAFYAHGKRIASSDPENSRIFLETADKFIQTLVNMQKYALRGDGHGIVAAVNPSGALVWPGDEISKETWRYYPLLHTAASAWTGLALHYIKNGDEFANPYADYSKKKVDTYFGPVAATPTGESQNEPLAKTYSIGIAALVISVVLGLVILSALVVLSVLNVRLYRRNKEIEDVDRGSRTELMAFTQLASPDTPNSPADDSPR